MRWLYHGGEGPSCRTSLTLNCFVLTVAVINGQGDGKIGPTDEPLPALADCGAGRKLQFDSQAPSSMSASVALDADASPTTCSSACDSAWASAWMRSMQSRPAQTNDACGPAAPPLPGSGMPLPSFVVSKAKWANCRVHAPIALTSLLPKRSSLAKSFWSLPSRASFTPRATAQRIDSSSVSLVNQSLIKSLVCEW